MAQGERMINKVVWTVFFVLINFEAFACSCKNLSSQEYFDGSTYIVTGRIINLKMAFDENYSPFQKITLDEVEYLKGKKSSVIFASMNMDSCQGEIFQLGASNIFFVSEDNWSLGWCGGTQQLDERLDYQVDFVNAIRTLSRNVQ
jgi:hypothetical protein